MPNGFYHALGRQMTNGDSNEHLEPNGLDPEPWTSNHVDANHSTPPPPSPTDTTGFEHVSLALPTDFNLHPPVPHAIVPDGLLEAPSRGRSFLDFTPDIVSAEDDVIRYYAVIRTIGDFDEGTAVARTFERCDVQVITEDCRGRSRLAVGQLVQLRYHLEGEFQGMTFAECAASECTPAPSQLGSRPPSWAVSRPPSRPPSQPPSRPPSRRGSSLPSPVDG